MYNAGSLTGLLNGQPVRASTDPVTGVVSMSLYGLFLSTGFISPPLYRVLKVVSVVLIGCSVMVTNLLDISHLDLY